MEEVSKLGGDVFSGVRTTDDTRATGFTSYLPAILVFAGAIAMLLLRLQVGTGFISDGALMMLALAWLTVSTPFVYAGPGLLHSGCPFSAD